MNFNPFGGWPLSGAVTQSLFSPQIALNFRGDAAIEADVVNNVASYGRQIGRLTDAVLALAGDSDAEAIRELREIAVKVDAVKARHLADAEEAARDHLDKLRKVDPAAFDRLLRSYRS